MSEHHTQDVAFCKFSAATACPAGAVRAPENLSDLAIKVFSVLKRGRRPRENVRRLHAWFVREAESARNDGRSFPAHSPRSLERALHSLVRAGLIKKDCHRRGGFRLVEVAGVRRAGPAPTSPDPFGGIFIPPNSRQKSRKTADKCKSTCDVPPLCVDDVDLTQLEKILYRALKRSRKPIETVGALHAWLSAAAAAKKRLNNSFPAHSPRSIERALQGLSTKIGTVRQCLKRGGFRILVLEDLSRQYTANIPPNAVESIPPNQDLKPQETAEFCKSSLAGARGTIPYATDRSEGLSTSELYVASTTCTGDRNEPVEPPGQTDTPSSPASTNTPQPRRHLRVVTPENPHQKSEAKVQAEQKALTEKRPKVVELMRRQGVSPSTIEAFRKLWDLKEPTKTDDEFFSPPENNPPPEDAEFRADVNDGGCPDARQSARAG